MFFKNLFLILSIGSAMLSLHAPYNHAYAEDYSPDPNAPDIFGHANPDKYECGDGTFYTTPGPNCPIPCKELPDDDVNCRAIRDCPTPLLGSGSSFSQSAYAPCPTIAEICNVNQFKSNSFCTDLKATCAGWDGDFENDPACTGVQSDDNNDQNQTADQKKLVELCKSNPSDPQCADLNDAQQKAAEAKARENSTANKLIDAAAIGATGIGASQLMEGMAEKSADTSSAQAIAAYTATITCGIPGSSVDGLKTGDGGQAPVPPKFTDLKSQYVGLAAKLKAAKEALGMPPGIESQFVDKSSLYDYGENGAGGFKSTLDTAQARLDSGAAQKMINTGLTTAAVGIGVGVVGNLLVNDIAPKLGQGDVTKYGGAAVTTASDFKTTFNNVQNFYNAKCAETSANSQACADLKSSLDENKSLVNKR